MTQSNLILPTSSDIDWRFGSLSEATFLRTYSRTKDNGDKETWPEAVERIVRGAQAIGAKLTPHEETVLAKLHLEFKALVAGRAMWMLGTGMIERAGSDALINCWNVDLKAPADFEWAMNRHLVGGGVGFVLDDIAEFGVIHDARVEHVVGSGWSVPDTREGWAQLIGMVMASFQTGFPLTFNTDAVRPAGAPLMTFGGYASGPEVLVEGVKDICKVVAARKGKRLRPVDAGDVANIIARIVVAGSARRSAQLLLGSSLDPDFVSMKDWSKGDLPYWRGQSNNTIVANAFDQIPESYWEQGWDGSGEVLGLYNRHNAQTYGRMGEYAEDLEARGTNPCAETTLRHRDSCNLSTLALPNFDSLEEMVEASIVMYKVQKAITQLSHPDKYTQEQMNRISRIGQSIGGWCQSTDEQLEWPSEVYTRLKAFDVEWSASQGLNESVRLTAVKPDGTTSLLLGTTPGVHGAYSSQYIRRMRIGVADPLWSKLEARGHHVEQDIMIDGNRDPRQLVVEFPIKVPANARIASDMSAIEQLELSQHAQAVWADQSVSVTITYEDHEVSEIREWMSENWATMKTASFLRHSGHGFKLAPYEPISEDDFRAAHAAIRTDIPLSGGLELDETDCASGACPIR